MHRSFGGVVDPFSFSTIHLLRTCNRLIAPTEFRPYYNLMKDSSSLDYSPANPESLANLSKGEVRCPEIGTIYPVGCSKELSSTLPTIPAATACSPLGVECHPQYSRHPRIGDLSYPNLLSRRQRGEKKPIPDEQKDEKYYERRKRNNEAAKKSRDARKMREDRIAFRAALLEQENAILRAQVIALREEMTTLRQMMGTRPAQISVNL